MTARRPIAFLSMESLEGFFTYDHLAADVLRARGREVEFVPWRRAEEWSRFAAVVVRSPWDYQQDPAHFMDVLRAIEASGTPLHNPVAVAEWNLAKTYLLHLERAGVPIVPTRIGRVPSRDALCALAMEFGAEEMVLKPVIGANADGAFRLRAPFDDARAHEAVACYRERECLAQPFLRSIVEEGEVSLFYFFGELSHAIIKRPAPGDFRVQEEHGGTDEAIAPDAVLAASGARALAAVPFRELLYARVDLARRADGAWAVMEIELIEPSLYLEYDPAAPARFADAVERVARG
jgi:glutathione synthase/RimK-type ligase-like ATP-grasp enzyme